MPLDFELEMGIRRARQRVGQSINIAEATSTCSGLCCSTTGRATFKSGACAAGPFHGQERHDLHLPRVVTTAALAPFHCSTSAGQQTDPVPHPYLRDPNYGSYDIQPRCPCARRVLP